MDVHHNRSTESGFVIESESSESIFLKAVVRVVKIKSLLFAEIGGRVGRVNLLGEGH
jgi:hypothetical protein